MAYPCSSYSSNCLYRSSCCRWVYGNLPYRSFPNWHIKLYNLRPLVDSFFGAFYCLLDSYLIIILFWARSSFQLEFLFLWVIHCDNFVSNIVLHILGLSNQVRHLQQAIWVDRRNDRSNGLDYDNFGYFTGVLWIQCGKSSCHSVNKRQAQSSYAWAALDIFNKITCRSRYNCYFCNPLYRGLAEWSNAAVLKTVVPCGTGGSNPSPSALLKPDPDNPGLGFFFLQVSIYRSIGL